MDDLECSGLWWLPSNAEATVAGSLSFSEASQPRLRLLGAFQGAGDFGTTIEPGAILGLTEDGKLVTLYRPYEVRSKLGAMHTTEFEAAAVLIGAHFSTPEDVVFSKMGASYDHLSAWTGLSGFSRDLGTRAADKQRVVRVEYQKPVPISASLGDVSIRFPSSFHLKGMRGPRVEMTETVYAEAEPSAPKQMEEFQATLQYNLRNFISLGTGVPLRLVSEFGTTTDSALGPDGKPIPGIDVEIYHQEPLIVERRAEPLHPVYMLFTLRDIRDQLSECLGNWLGKATVLGPVYDLYFGSLYAPRMYLQTRFLSLAQAVESYHRLTTKGSYLPRTRWRPILKGLRAALKTHAKEADADVRSVLSARMGYMNEYTLRTRISQIADALGSPVVFLIPDADSFIRLLSDTRNYLTHYDKRLKEKAAKGIALHLLAERLRFLLELCFLKEIGLSEQQIDTIVHRNQRYIGLKRLAGQVQSS